MRAILLVAGKGERLGRVTETIPKPMLKVKGEIILEHNIKWLKKHGIKDFYINLHYLPEVVKDYFGDGHKWGVSIKYSYESRLLGTAGAVRNIVNCFKEDKWGYDFFVIYSDNFYPFHYNLKAFADFYFKKKGLISIGLYRKKRELYKSGVVFLDKDNRISGFIEKPKNVDRQEGGLINTGIYVVNKQLVDYIPRGFSDFGIDIFPKLIKRKIPMYGYVFRKSLIAVDTLELYQRARGGRKAYDNYKNTL